MTRAKRISIFRRCTTAVLPGILLALLQCNPVLSQQLDTQKENLGAAINSPYDEVYPLISPDGRKVIFERDYQVFLINSDGSETIQLTSIGSNYNPNFSYDGEKIIFESWRDGDGEIFIMNVDGSGQKSLTDNDCYDGCPVFRPL